MKILRGFSTLELMLALMIISSALSAIVLVTLGIPQSLAEGHKADIVANAASALLDKEFAIGMNSFSSVHSIASTTVDGYTTSLLVTTLPDGLTKRLESTATWQDNRGQQHYLELFGLVTDFRNATTTTCSSVLVGDWTHPYTRALTFVPGGALPIGSALTAHPISTVTTGTSTLAVGVTSARSKTDDTLFLFSISSSTDPTYLGSLDNAPSTRMGLAALIEHDGVIYAANAVSANYATCSVGSACSQLQIIDATNPTVPRVVLNFQLPTTTPPFAIGSGSQSAGKSIFYVNGLLYLGLQKSASTQGEEFNILDVHDPESPIWLGGYSIGRTVNQIDVVNGYAYLATDDPNRELTILDVHDPKNITLAGSYDAPGNGSSGFGEGVSVASTTVALGRSYILNQPEFSLLDVASGTTPTILSSQIINGLGATASVEALLIRNFLAFVLTNSSLQFWDISDRTHPSKYADTLSLPANSTISGTSSFTCRDNTLYIASSDTNHVGYLTIITGS